VIEGLVRVMPLPLRDEGRGDPTGLAELARFRLRIVAPLSRVGHRLSGDRAALVDVGPVRVIALDTANEWGGVGGSLDSDQAAWLVRQLEEARDRYVVIATHDSSLTLTSDRVPPGRAPRVLGPELAAILLAHPTVVAWVSATLHHRGGRRHGQADHGFWELPGATEGREAPLAGGLSISRRADGRTLVMHGALAAAQGPLWEVRDPLAAVAPVGRPRSVGAGDVR
jgi:hypothetical protein